jgi:hypothetical protein
MEDNMKTDKNQKVQIDDLEQNKEISQEELKNVRGGTTFRINAETDKSTIISPYGNETSKEWRDRMGIKDK